MVQKETVCVSSHVRYYTYFVCVGRAGQLCKATVSTLLVALPVTVVRQLRTCQDRQSQQQFAAV